MNEQMNLDNEVLDDIVMHNERFLDSIIKPFTQWTVDEVANWLRNAHELPDEAEIFAFNGIQGHQLQELDFTHLGSMGSLHIERILLARDCLIREVEARHQLGARSAVANFEFAFGKEGEAPIPIGTDRINVVTHTMIIKDNEKRLCLRFLPAGENRTTKVLADVSHIPLDRIYVLLTGCRFNLCTNHKRCEEEETKRQNTGRPRAICAAREAIKVHAEEKEDRYFLPVSEVILLHHLQIAGSARSAELRAELVVNTSSSDEPFFVPFLAPNQHVAVLRMSVNTRTKKRKIPEPVNITYLEIEPKEGRANTANLIAAHFEADTTPTPACNLEVFFVGNGGGPDRPTIPMGVIGTTIFCKTPPSPVGTYQTYIKVGSRRNYGRCDATNFHFEAVLYASADPPPPQANDPYPDLEAVLAEIETAFKPYHPKIDGPLTMQLLHEITERECYQQMGFTPLIVAAYVGEEALVEALVKEGANPLQSDINGRSAIWWSRRGWEPDKIKRKGNLKDEKPKRNQTSIPPLPAQDNVSRRMNVTRTNAEKIAIGSKAEEITPTSGAADPPRRANFQRCATQSVVGPPSRRPLVTKNRRFQATLGLFAVACLSIIALECVIHIEPRTSTQSAISFAPNLEGWRLEPILLCPYSSDQRIGIECWWKNATHRQRMECDDVIVIHPYWMEEQCFILNNRGLWTINTSTSLELAINAEETNHLLLHFYGTHIDYGTVVLQERCYVKVTIITDIHKYSIEQNCQLPLSNASWIVSMALK